VSFDARGLIVSRNTIAAANDNGIEILRTAIGDDGTLVADNRIRTSRQAPPAPDNMATPSMRSVPAM
jgi:hypothetical protein